MQMHPAPIPPMGIATCVAPSPLKLRCGPSFNRSAEEKGDRLLSGATILGSEPDCASAPAGMAGTAAASAAVEPATRNSRRLGFSIGMKNLAYAMSLTDAELSVAQRRWIRQLAPTFFPGCSVRQVKSSGPPDALCQSLSSQLTQESSGTPVSSSLQLGSTPSQEMAPATASTAATAKDEVQPNC